MDKSKRPLYQKCVDKINNLPESETEDDVELVRFCDLAYEYFCKYPKIEALLIFRILIEETFTYVRTNKEVWK